MEEKLTLDWKEEEERVEFDEEMKSRIFDERTKLCVPLTEGIK